MNNKLIKTVGILIFIIIAIFTGVVAIRNNQQTLIEKQENQGGLEEKPHPLSIEYMKQQSYPGSEITIEQTLPSGSNYNQYIASYKSDGLKIYALLAVPQSAKPKNGWPVIIFNHGYIQPAQYRTTERYTDYIDAFARNGYIVFKSDYRGHGNSEGKAESNYFSPGYVIDVLNALASIKKNKEVDPEKIGIWGHSMGGNITMKSLVISQDIKAAVIWAGVVGSYPDLLTNWRRRNVLPSPGISSTRRWRDDLVSKYGQPGDNPRFWDSISANNYLADISGPLQLHHGTADASVPLEFSKTLEAQMKAVGKEVEFYTYEGDDHNFSRNLSLALRRSVEFFDTILKH